MITLIARRTDFVQELCKWQRFMVHSRCDALSHAIEEFHKIRIAAEICAERDKIFEVADQRRESHILAAIDSCGDHALLLSHIALEQQVDARQKQLEFTHA